MPSLMLARKAHYTGRRIAVLIAAIILSACESMSPPGPEAFTTYATEVKPLLANPWLFLGTSYEYDCKPFDYLNYWEFKPDGMGTLTQERIGYAKPGKIFFLNAPFGHGVFHGTVTWQFQWWPLGGGKIHLAKSSKGEETGDYPGLEFNLRRDAITDDIANFLKLTPLGPDDPRRRFSAEQIAMLTNRWNVEGPPLVDGAARRETAQNIAGFLGVMAAAAPLMTATQSISSAPPVGRHLPATSPPVANSGNGTANIISHQDAPPPTVAPSTVSPRASTNVPAPGVQMNYGAAIVSATNALAPPRNDPKKLSPGRQVYRRPFGQGGVQIEITITKIYTYLGAEANRGEPYNSTKTTFDGTFTNNNTKVAQFQFWVDAVFNNGRTLPINDGHGGLNGGRSIDKYLGSFEGADWVQMANFKMNVKLK